MVLSSIILGVSTEISQRALSSCVASWADQYTATAKVRSVAQQTRVDALHRLVQDAIDKKPQSVIDEDAVTFNQVEHDYQLSVKSHPLPDPPKIRC